MSKLLFKEYEYSLANLLTLRTNSPFYKNGDVTDQDDGVTVDISRIDVFRDKYIDELIDLRKKYGTKNSAILTGVTRKVIDNEILKDLQCKFNKDNKSISVEELVQLINLKLKKRNMLKLNFDSFYIRNKKKDFPKELTFNDVGRYDKLLGFLTKYSDIRERNRKDSNFLETEKLTNVIELSEKRFFQYLNKLQKNNLIKYIKEINNDLIIFINPVYAYMQGEIDYTIYTLFKEDLNEYLTLEEIEYLKRIYEINKLRYTNRISYSHL